MFVHLAGPVSRDSVAQNTNDLLNFINSHENKRIFVQLSNSDYAFYDYHRNLVGTARFPLKNKYQQQPYVANGYIGSRIPNLGQGFTYDQLDNSDNNTDNLSNGWPLFNQRYAGAFVAGFFDIQHNTTQTNFPELLANGYESVIAAIPQWTSLQLAAKIANSTATLDPAAATAHQGSVSDYVQTMSLNHGVVTTEFTWLNTFRVKYQVLAHRKYVSLGIVNLQVSNLNNSDAELTVEDRLDFATAQRCQLVDVGHDSTGIYINFQPHQIDYINGTVYSRLESSLKANFSRTKNHTRVSQKTKLHLKKRSSVTLTKYVGIVTTDLDPQAYKSSEHLLNFAKKTALHSGSFTQLFEEHQEEWDKTLKSSVAITFPDDQLLTMTSRASAFHLAANTRPEAQGVTGALGVGGLSSDSYAGLVFWDSDLWMLNGILPFVPDRAKSIVNYRIHTHEQAIDNVPKGYSGAVYPWTSGRFGNCTATGPCLDYEYHINMAVSFAAWQVYLSGYGDDEYLKDTVFPLIYDAASFMADYVQYNSSLKAYTTHNLTDPDEYANHVDNGAYTNAGISSLMKFAVAIGSHLEEDIPSNFTNIAGNMNLPFSDGDDDITLEYTGMNSSVGIKQADVVMITYPLNNELITKDQAYTNMQFYAMKQVNYGPAMTFPIFSIVSSALSLSGCSSQSYLYKAMGAYLRTPFAQFAEQNNDDFATNGGTHPAFPFLTAHGGFLQAVLQGLTGLRYDFEVKDGQINRMLGFDPISVPLVGKAGVRFEGVKYMNNSLSLKVNETYFIVSNNGPVDEYTNASETITIKIGDRNIKAGKYELEEGDILEIPLTVPKASSPDSVCECASATFTNITEGAFGDSAFSINDGDNFTHWQAKYNDTTAKVLIDLKEFKNITGGEINWGDSPPQNWSLSLFELQRDWDTHELLASVDFGGDVNNQYRFFKTDQDIIDQDDAFTVLIEEDVEISSPFNESEFLVVEVPDKFNITRFELDDPALAKFLLLEFSNIHNKEPVDPSSTGGGKLYEVMLF
ncbi:hypothetical protein CANTEDRAFT_130360 [Yamadazyma tenuis ATCC 10573]|uniref:alpha,alpha-trehalase n=1 Tax=Candida tenuis (strain ATCC 10573 / BCRC 21748 / CBS 615 / JCM 9827 / NBRC 10315 / NRRL Y-1498 / VKM Y-70) TaxID=590646 RepID=G3B4X5_CANTC|nr:uncharacterized protein CANTEDRAFT_130360 [Yamadazyma tenuis ATCC 10573]EGV64014.1 hypothetical protein CANTEDRAFT_130360 [Yamadazyma tenuis ATCC 10573]